MIEEDTINKTKYPKGTKLKVGEVLFKDLTEVRKSAKEFIPKEKKK